MRLSLMGQRRLPLARWGLLDAGLAGGRRLTGSPPSRVLGGSGCAAPPCSHSPTLTAGGAGAATKLPAWARGSQPTPPRDARWRRTLSEGQTPAAESGSSRQGRSPEADRAPASARLGSAGKGRSPASSPAGRGRTQELSEREAGDTSAYGSETRQLRSAKMNARRFRGFAKVRLLQMCHV